MRARRRAGRGERPLRAGGSRDSAAARARRTRAPALADVGMRRERRRAYRSAAGRESRAVDVVGERCVETRHEPADERGRPRAPRRRSGRQRVRGREQVQRSQKLSAPDARRRREDRVLVVEVDARRGLGEREVEPHELGDVGAAPVVEPEPAGDVRSRCGAPRSGWSGPASALPTSCASVATWRTCGCSMSGSGAGERVLVTELRNERCGAQ